MGLVPAAYLHMRCACLAGRVCTALFISTHLGKSPPSAQSELVSGCDGVLMAVAGHAASSHIATHSIVKALTTRPRSQCLWRLSRVFAHLHGQRVDTSMPWELCISGPAASQRP